MPPSPPLSRRVVEALSSPGAMRSAVVLDCVMFWTVALSKGAAWSLIFAAVVVLLQGLAAASFFLVRHRLAAPVAKKV